MPKKNRVGDESGICLLWSYYPNDDSPRTDAIHDPPWIPYVIERPVGFLNFV